jgi:hypothetical protein
MDIMMVVPTSTMLSQLALTKARTIRTTKPMIRTVIKTSKSKCLTHESIDLTFNQDSNGVRRPKPNAAIPAHQQYDLQQQQYYNDE